MPTAKSTRALIVKKSFLFASFSTILCFGSALADPLPINQLPMYGELPKTEAMKTADTTFIHAIERQGLTRAEGAKQALRMGWDFWEAHDTPSAMLRFNQAWLLDPSNGNAYHGFALVTSMRSNTSAEVERLFEMAVTKKGTSSTAFVDYGRFLWTQKQLDRSLAQLDKALQISSTAKNARSNISFVHYLKGDYAKACIWAKSAKMNSDILEKGFLEDVCSRPGKT